MNFSTLALRSRQAARVKVPRSLLPQITLRFRYSLFYFCYLSFWAVSHAFLPLYMDSLGYAPHEVGILGVILNAAAIVSPPVILSLAHARFPARKLLYVTSAVVPISFLPLIFLKNFLHFAFAYLVFNLLFRAPFAVVEPQAIRDGETGLMRYEHARSWGSLGYIICMLLIGALVDRGRITAVFLLALLLLVGTFFSGGLIAERLPQGPTKGAFQRSRENFRWYNFGNQAFWALMGICFLIWGSHSVMGLYLSLYLRELGWSGTMISTVWMVGVLGEIVVFHLFGRLMWLLGLKNLLTISICMTVVRWSLFGLCDTVIWILVAQALHMFSFGGVYFSAVKLVYRLLPEEERDRGQGLLFSAGPGFGLMLGNCLVSIFATGMTSYREVNCLFLAAAVAAGTSLLLLPLLPRER